MTEQQRKQYQEKADEQLQAWVDGKPFHNHYSLCGDPNGECCPDFSCCNGKLLAPREVREAFKKAHDEGDRATVDRMLVGFLGGMLEGEGHEVVTSADVVADNRGDLGEDPQ